MKKLIKIYSLTTIIIIAIIIAVLSFVSAKLVHNYIPNKWNVSYVLEINQQIKNDVNYIDKILYAEGIKKANFDIQISKKIGLDIIRSEQVARNDPDLLNGIQNLQAGNSYVNFDTDDLENANEKLDRILLFFNRNINDLINLNIEDSLEAILEKARFDLQVKYDELDKSINMMTDLNESFVNSNAKQSMVAEELVKKLSFNMFYRQFIPKDYVQLDGLTDVENEISLDGVISILRFVQKQQKFAIDNFSSNSLMNDFYFQEIINKKKGINQKSYLSVFERTGALNKKPRLKFLTISFFLFGFIFVLIVSFLHLNSSFLLGKIRKKLKVWLYLG